MITVNPYLTFDGNCLEAFTHYRKVFGGEFEANQKFKDEPGSNHPPSDADRILHISLPLSKGFFLMGSDRATSMGPGKQGDNISLSINTTSRKEADDVFKGLAKGGNVTMPIATTFWGSYFGMVNDKFGIQWMVSFAESR
jgi:PhnB protein